MTAAAPIVPVHTGSGDQYNQFVWARAGARALRAVALDEQRWLLRRFVEPSNYNEAWETLAGNGCVLLTGPAGSGRNATARMLLFRLPGPYVPLREVSDRPDQPDEPVLDASSVERGDRLLLTMTATDESWFRRLLPRLSSYRAEVRERGAHLVVVLRSGWDRSLAADLASLGVEIGRPDGLLVLRRHLRAERVVFEVSQLGDPDLLPRLTSAPIETIAALARLVRVGRDRMTGTLPDWLRAALKAVSDQDSDVLAQLRDIDDARQRALLLASAMLSGASADAVHHATTALLDAVHFPPDDRPLLARPSLTGRLTDIKIHTDTDRRIGFDTLGYDEAVRTHFWTNFPDLRPDFRDWIGTAITLPDLDGADRAELVRRFAVQVLRIDRPADLIELAVRWANADCLPQAGMAMELGLASARHGAVFRRRIYEWSIDRAIVPNLVALAIRMCVEVLALTHPEQALVRLHHLVRRQAGAAGAAAWDALLDLVDSDRRQLRRMLDRLATRLTWEADLDLFLALAKRTSPLLGSLVVREQVTTCWHAVLTRRAARGWADPVRDWLTVAVAADRGLLLGVLVAAGGDDAGVLSRLYVVARDWAREPGADREQRVQLAAELADRIDAAQGIEP
ncbi:MAG TPA: hypothetical protein VH333_24120 [Pseudonocardiaceae bacterium]|jgi:hypothetical protein|nr:hypothetical protein [Pseudonocardiaceae bacterium]